MKGAITCIAGVESLVKQEITRSGGKVLEVHDRVVFFEGETKILADLNIWSRVGNKVYAQIAQDKIETFDDLFDILASIRWDRFIPRGGPVLVDALSIKSLLSSVPTLQKIGKKAIVAGITGRKDVILTEDPTRPSVRIFLLFLNDVCHILLDTSGDPLHRRGYREEAGQAPLKETLAAALVLLSSWKFSRPLYDPFCGSGTILIEAAMIAKNIAPGLQRRFALEHLPFGGRDMILDAKTRARDKMFLAKEHKIIGFDIDKDTLKIAKQNAKFAGVADYIVFSQGEFPQSMDVYGDTEGMVLCNPPYGMRLMPGEAESVHLALAQYTKQHPNMHMGIYTGYEDHPELFARNSAYKSRKLYNGDIRAYLFTKV